MWTSCRVLTNNPGSIPNSLAILQTVNSKISLILLAVLILNLVVQLLDALFDIQRSRPQALYRRHLELLRTRKEWFPLNIFLDEEKPTHADHQICAARKLRLVASISGKDSGIFLRQVASICSVYGVLVSISSWIPEMSSTAPVCPHTRVVERRENWTDLQVDGLFGCLCL